MTKLVQLGEAGTIAHVDFLKGLMRAEACTRATLTYRSMTMMTSPRVREAPGEDLRALRRLKSDRRGWQL